MDAIKAQKVSWAEVTLSSWQYQSENKQRISFQQCARLCMWSCWGFDVFSLFHLMSKHHLMLNFQKWTFIFVRLFSPSSFLKTDCSSIKSSIDGPVVTVWNSETWGKQQTSVVTKLKHVSWESWGPLKWLWCMQRDALHTQNCLIALVPVSPQILNLDTPAYWQQAARQQMTSFKHIVRGRAVKSWQTVNASVHIIPSALTGFPMHEFKAGKKTWLNSFWSDIHRVYQCCGFTVLCPR